MAATTRALRVLAPSRTPRAAAVPYRWGLDPVQTEVAVWAVLALPLLLTAVGFMTLLPMVHTMLSNAADPRTQGAAEWGCAALHACAALRAGVPLTPIPRPRLCAPQA